jgi:hypothetical protein
LLGLLGIAGAISLWLGFGGDASGKTNMPVRSAEIYYFTPRISRPECRDLGEVRPLQNLRAPVPVSGHS